jgi:hypothetical protein
MSNPYEDEDTINSSIDMNMNTNNDRVPPFFKVFKQVGDSLRNGGFCNVPKQSSQPKSHSHSQSKSRSTMRKEKKTSESAAVAVTSEADEVEVVVETDSDGEYSEAQEKIKSVTFHDLAEPLIVPEEEEETTTATANSTIASSSKSRSAPMDDNSQSKSSFVIFTSIVAIIIAALVSISFVQPHLLINLMESSETTAKLMESEQMQTIVNQIKSVMTTCDDCPMIKMTGTAILVAFVAVASDRVKGMTSNVAIVGFVEFLWGAIVYGMIAVGVYSSETTAKLMELEQMQSSLNQIKSVISTCDDCPWIKMTGTAILVAFLAVASDRVKGMTSNVTIVGFVEFLWGAMVYGIIAVGVYYIYN